MGPPSIRSAAIAFFLATTVVVAFEFFDTPGLIAQKSNSDDVFPLRLDAIDPEQGKLRVPTGERSDAIIYYKKIGERLPALRGTAAADLKGLDLDKLLDYFGYGGTLRAEDLATLHPSTLMHAKELTNHLLAKNGKAPAANDLLNWDILAARYFSPKTSDVSKLSDQLSWRSAIRMRARPKSAAENDGLHSFYFLSVVYVANLERDPFANTPLNVQVMLVGDWQKKHKLVDPVAWMVFDPSQKYALGHSTTTSWDAADPKFAKKQGKTEYFVPNACASCHNGKAGKSIQHPRASLNFFDTDYIVERTTPGDDFERTLGRSDWGPLRDAGRAPYTQQFLTGFDAFRKMNAEILKQNEGADPKSRMAAAAKGWLRAHERSSLYVAPILRGLKANDVDGLRNSWSETNPIDFKLVPLLTRYCYRCHSTLYYNVLNKDEVLEERVDMIKRLLSTNTTERMPQDRILTKSERDDLVSLLKSLE